LPSVLLATSAVIAAAKSTVYAIFAHTKEKKIFFFFFFFFPLFVSATRVDVNFFFSFLSLDCAAPTVGVFACVAP
jgi:hypothetical protein